MPDGRPSTPSATEELGDSFLQGDYIIKKSNKGLPDVSLSPHNRARLPSANAVSDAFLLFPWIPHLPPSLLFFFYYFILPTSSSAVMSSPNPGRSSSPLHFPTSSVGGTPRASRVQQLSGSGARESLRRVVSPNANLF